MNNDNRNYGNFPVPDSNPAYRRRFPELAVIERPGHGKVVAGSLLPAEEILKDMTREEFYLECAAPGREHLVPTDYTQEIIKEGLTA